MMGAVMEAPPGAPTLGPSAALDPDATFSTPEAAWMWMMRRLLARRDPTPLDRSPEPARCCEPEDVVAAADHLRRHRRIDRGHTRVLAVYGERGEAPSRRTHAPGQDVVLWREAMAALGQELRLRSIVR